MPAALRVFSNRLLFLSSVVSSFLPIERCAAARLHLLRVFLRMPLCPKEDVKHSPDGHLSVPLAQYAGFCGSAAGGSQP